MATSLDRCLGHMKYNMADASQALLMLLGLKIPSALAQAPG